MQSVNAAELLNNSSLSLSFGFTAGDGTGGIDIVLLKSIFASLKSHKLNFNIAVFHLIWISVLHVSREPSFISTQFFALNLDG